VCSLRRSPAGGIDGRVVTVTAHGLACTVRQNDTIHNGDPQLLTIPRSLKIFTPHARQSWFVPLACPVPR
jgi:hypothetical protein